jgi:hypothetical protein
MSRRKGGSKAAVVPVKGQHWREEEVRLLLDIVEDILPRGGNEWTLCANQYNSKRQPWMAERDDDQIKNKYKALKNVKKPTGDPTIPPLVLRAKRIQNDIETKICVATLDDGIDDGIIPGIIPSLPFAEEDAEVPFPPDIPMEDYEEQDDADDTLPEMPPSTVTTTPIANSIKATTYRTTPRVGHSEERLIALSRGIPESEATRKRRKLDNALDSMVNQSAQSRDSMTSVLLVQMQNDSRRRDDERDERREREQRMQEEREYQRAEDRRRYEEQRADDRRRDEERMMMMMQFASKLFEK